MAKLSSGEKAGPAGGKPLVETWHRNRWRNWPDPSRPNSRNKYGCRDGLSGFSAGTGAGAGWTPVTQARGTGWVLEWTGSQLSLPWEQAWEWVTAGRQLPLPEELARVQGNAECYLPGEWYRDWLGPNGTANRSRLRDRSWGWETCLGMETGREK